MIFPIIFFYFIFFITINAEKTHEEVAKKFDDFIDIFFEISPSAPTDTHNQFTLLDYWNLTNLLRMAEHHVAKPVLEVQNGQQPEIEQIYNVKNIYIILKFNFYRNFKSFWMEMLERKAHNLHISLKILVINRENKKKFNF